MVTLFWNTSKGQDNSILWQKAINRRLFQNWRSPTCKWKILLFFLQLFTNTEAKKLTAYLSQCCRSNPVRHQMDIILFSCSLGSCNLLDMSCMLWTVPQHMSLKWWLEIIMILPFDINLYPIKKSIAQYHAISDINILWLIIVTIKPLNSWKDQHLISLYTLNTESNILVIRIQ